MRSNTLAIVALSFALAACASTPTVEGTAAADVRSSANRITAAEITTIDVPSAYDVIDRLHRPWFQDRSAGASGEVFVYVDNRAIDEGKDALRQIPAREIALIEYLKSSDAVIRFGEKAKGGAIIVTRK
jgi:predicted small secreted protein